MGSRHAISRTALSVATSTALVLAISLASAPAANAYGKKAVWQIALSANCNNPKLCGDEGLGGFWGWAEFDSDNTADAEFTGCGHLQGGGGGGAGHESIEVDGWFIGDNGNFWIESEDITFIGHGPPVTVHDPEPPYPADTGVPAAPGHYSIAEEVFGFSGPGVNFIIQVVLIPGR
jgi:hypothetical protein